MTVLIISDTHGILANLDKVIPRVKPDLIYHLGDCQGQEDLIAQMANCPVECVRGNCDFMSALPRKVITTLGRHQVMLTHGHLYDVKYSTGELALAAEKEGCDTVMYGHTHWPELVITDKMTIVNPGSISLPRQPGRMPSFVVCDVDKEGDLHFAINYLE
ncbi:MAG: YfcE family phosphodiesterase [Lachnospiraceae bacterium]|nr:YfcE family phosphodiesterase [Lachnospiraceae bacterium]